MISSRAAASGALDPARRLARTLEVEPYELLLPENAVSRLEVPEADRIAVLLERVEAEQRGTILRVLEGFTQYTASRKRGPRRVRGRG